MAVLADEFICDQKIFYNEQAMREERHASEDTLNPFTKTNNPLTDIFSCGFRRARFLSVSSFFLELDLFHPLL